ncbi:translation initiation factor IF-2-like [Phacochoerus africanus]|uniref:translation initiation factor IF-2-like n=1 Tax=Phacochoerus africanus TaxID=41426 RepID=UPI001FD8D492|nr:translation initiation factor IF-2-like [Phacochoerus africanus]
MPAAARRAAGAQAAGGGLRRHRARRAPTTLSTSPLLAPALPGHLPPPAPRSAQPGSGEPGGGGKKTRPPPRARQLFPVAATGPQRTPGRHRSSLGVVGLGEPPEAGRRGPGARGEGGALGRRLVGRSRSHRGLNKGGGGGCACAQRRGGGGALGESAGLVLPRPGACGGVAGGTPLRPALRSRSRAGAPYAGRAWSWAFGFVKALLNIGREN